MSQRREGLRLAVTVGDPAGIGPEIVAAALRTGGFGTGAAVTVVGERAVLDRARIPADSGVQRVEIEGDFFDPTRDPIGRPTAASGASAARTLLVAIDLALAGDVDGVVTAPLSKEALAMAGHPWPGQTEVLIERAGVPRGVMLFVAADMRVALATRHVALSAVPKTLNVADLAADLRLLAAGLGRDCGLARPRIAVCGLNPHAGEGGLFGDEERTIIAPAMAAVDGAELIGPLPADTVFVRQARGEFDAVMAMYHDQGLIPVKVRAFGGGVNVTLGLPFIRTSPDHGTAYDIAGRGVADPSSLIEAFRVAEDMAEQRRRVPAPGA